MLMSAAPMLMSLPSVSRSLTSFTSRGLACL